MRFKFRSLWIFGLPLATGLAPAAGEAAGLGEAVLRSGINQPLRLEIPLLGEDAAALDASCFRLQSSGSDDLPWLTDAQLRIEHASRLVVTTRRSISHPVMMIGITAGCGAALQPCGTKASCNSTRFIGRVQTSREPAALDVPW